MQVSFETINAQNPTGATFTETATVTPPSWPGGVLIACSLQQVDQLAANGQARIAISGYTQDGQSHAGSWPVVYGKNISSLTIVLTVTGTRAEGTVLFLELG